MEAKIDFSEAPYDYPMCLDRECPKAGTCLRQLLERGVPADKPYGYIILPGYLATLKGDCPHYRPNTKVRFAKGFTGILDNLTQKQMRMVVARLRSEFSQRTYYRIRSGERLLSPSEQLAFLNILKNCGIPAPVEFDAYIEKYDW